MSDLAINLKKLREEKGISQHQLSQELDIKRSAYGNYETGMSFPEYNVLEQLAKYYNMKIESLLDLDNSFDKGLNIKKEAQELEQNIREYYYKKYRKIPSKEVVREIVKFIIEN